ncbi:hypothetical protein QVA66_08370 [Staphylococcus chromogenes]|nr:hypothetical protein [Staphylococcus chromogenes]
MPNKTLLLDARPARTLPEVFAAFTQAALPGRPAATNLDGFADYVREARINAIVLHGCRLQIPDYQILADVCQQLKVRLKTQP